MNREVITVHQEITLRACIRSPFFWLPATLFLGVAAQAAGLYLFACVLPVIVSRRQINWKHPQLDRLLFAGATLLLSWLLFPGFDLLHSWNELPKRLQSFSTAQNTLPLVVEKSLLPSTFLVTAVFLLGLGFFGRWQQKRATPAPYAGSMEPQVPPLDALLKGFWFFLIPALIYLLFQHFTGFDYRRETMNLGPSNQLAYGGYRVFGLYGHTLSVSAVSLLFLGLGLSFLTPRQTQGLALKRSRTNGIFITLFSVIILLASGSRSALFIGAAAGFTTLSLAVWKSRHRILIFCSLALSAAGASLALAKVGFFGRFQALYEALLTGDIEGQFTRLIFWKTYLTMWWDAFWLGHGPGRVTTLLRRNYYESLGYGDLKRKYEAHNIFLELLAGLGVVGTLTLFFLLLVGFRTWLGRSDPTADPLSRSFARGVFLGFLLNLLHCFTQNVFFDANVVAVLLAFCWVLWWHRLLSLPLTTRTAE